MILQPFGPQRCNDSRLWHLSLSVCLEGGRVWWEGVRVKRVRERETMGTKNTASSLLFTGSSTHFLLFSDLTWTACMIIPLSYMFCAFAVGTTWLSDGHSLNVRVRGSVDSEPLHHQSWLAWGGIHSFIKMTRWTFQILSFLCDIWLFILLFSSTRVSVVHWVLGIKWVSE